MYNIVVTRMEKIVIVLNASIMITLLGPHDIKIKNLLMSRTGKKRRLAVVISINNNIIVIFYHAMKAHDLNTIIIIAH